MSADRRQDETLLDDVREVMQRPAAPAAFHRRLHEAVDAGFLDPPSTRRRWPIALALAAAAAAAVGVVVVPRILAEPGTPAEPAALQIRSADGVPLAMEMSALAVVEEDAASSWVHAGDEIPARAWLRFRVEAPPGVHLVLARVGEDSEIEVFYRWPQEGGTHARVARDGDVWYSLDGRSGEQTFVCVASDGPLSSAQVASVARDGEVQDLRARLERLPVVVVE